MKDSLKKGNVINNRYEIAIEPEEHEGYISYFCQDRKLHGMQVVVMEFFPEYASRDENGNLVYSVNCENDMNKFRQKHQILKKLSALPTVSMFYEMFSANNTLYVVYEYLGGKNTRSISKKVERKRTFTSESVRRVVITMLKTNLALKPFGMFQCDFTPENIILADGENKNEKYVKINNFNPVSGIDAEEISIKSIASLGYFMLTGKDLSKGQKPGDISLSGNSARTAKYLKYIWQSNDVELTLEKFLEDAEKNFDSNPTESFSKKKIGVSSAQIMMTGAAVTSEAEKIRMKREEKTLRVIRSDKFKISIITAAVSVLIVFAITFFFSMKKVETIAKDATNPLENKLSYRIDKEYVKVNPEKSGNTKFSFPGKFKTIYLDKLAQTEAKSLVLKIEGDNSDIKVSVDGTPVEIFDYEADSEADKKKKSEYIIAMVNDEGKINVILTEKKFGLFEIVSEYDITYTKKPYAKLTAIEYTVFAIDDNNVKTEKKESKAIDDNTKSFEVNVSGYSTGIEFSPKAEEGKSYVYNNDTKLFKDINPESDIKTESYSITVTDPSAKEAENTYIINLKIDKKPVVQKDDPKASKAEASRQKAQEEARKKAVAEETARKKAEEAAKKAKEAEEARKAEDARKAEEARKAADEARKKSEKEAKKDEEERKKEEKAKELANESEEKEKAEKLKAIENARKKAVEEATRKEVEEARKKAVAAEAEAKQATQIEEMSKKAVEVLTKEVTAAEKEATEASKNVTAAKAAKAEAEKGTDEAAIKAAEEALKQAEKKSEEASKKAVTKKAEKEAAIKAADEAKVKAEEAGKAADEAKKAADEAEKQLKGE